MDSLRRTLLTFGYVREYCKSQNIDVLPDDIIGLFVTWLLFADYFDKNMSHPLTQTKLIDNNEYQHLSLKNQGTKYLNWYTAVGSIPIKKGERFTWKFKMDDGGIVSHYILLGIINNDMIKPNEAIADFTDPTWKGWGLFTNTMLKYHASNSGDGVYHYGNQFEYKKGDVIKMVLDLTQDNNGILSFDIDAQIADNAKLNYDPILFQKLNTNLEYRMAVALRCDRKPGDLPKVDSIAKKSSINLCITS